MIETASTYRPRIIAYPFLTLMTAAFLGLGSAGCGQIAGTSDVGAIDLSKSQPEAKGAGVSKGGSMRGAGLGGNVAPNAKKGGR